MRIFRRPKDQYDDPAATDFMWGVPRREGHSDTDDPAAHSGVMQHAFEFGRDDRAICGFEPPKRPSRAYRDARAQLAVPTRHNPKCRKCELLVASRVRGDEAVPVMDAAAREPQSEADAQPAADEPAGDQTPAPLAATDVNEIAPEADSLDARADDLVAEAEHYEERFDEHVDEQAEEHHEPGNAPQPQPTVESGEANAYGADAPVRLDAASARDPDFEPRAQAERARRRSVRRGGTVIVSPGRRSAVIDIPTSGGIAGIVANVEPEIPDVRVEAVTVGFDGSARVTLNKPAAEPVEVAWYIVSNPLSGSG